MDLLFNTNTKTLAFSGGDLVLVTDRQLELCQRLYVAFQTFKGEWYWNETYGIDYLNDVFGVGRLKFSVDTIIKNTILADPLVESIDYFVSEIVDYSYSCTFRVKTTDNQVTENIYFLTNENKLYLTTAAGQRIFAKL